MTGYLVTIALVLVGLKLLVWWCEPRIAFYPIRGVQETPAALKLPFTDVRIPTGDGETLHAWWLEAPSPGAQVVFFHGNGGNLSLWLGAIAGIRQRGLSVRPWTIGATATARAGRASGDYRDAEASIRALRTGSGRAAPRCSTGDGPSGAPVAAHAATRLAPDALVLECPMSNARSLLRTNPVLWLLSFFSSYPFATSELVQQLDIPLLVVHGDMDSIVPYAQRRTGLRAAPPRTRSPIPGADHNDLHVVNPQLYWQAIDTFIARVRPGSR